MKTVQEILGNHPVDGDIGLEIEVEGGDLPTMAQSKFWRAEEDGSLRGESKEYVFKKPLPIAKVWEALLDLSDSYKKYESRVEESFRAGTHVHINCQKLSMTKLFNFITLYIIFENLLIKSCGENRKGNLFCLSTSDAEYLLSSMRGSLKNVVDMKSPMHLAVFFANDNNVRYSSINVTALRKYGSLEFRSMRSTPKMDEIFAWVRVLFTIKNAALGFENPIEIMSEFSLNGADKFMRKCLGDVFAKKYSELSNDYKADLFAGVRNAQEIAYAVNWKELEKVIDETIGGGQKPEPVVQRRVEFAFEELIRANAQNIRARANARDFNQVQINMVHNEDDA